MPERRDDTLGLTTSSSSDGTPTRTTSNRFRKDDNTSVTSRTSVDSLRVTEDDEEEVVDVSEDSDVASIDTDCIAEENSKASLEEEEVKAKPQRVSPRRRGSRPSLGSHFAKESCSSERRSNRSFRGSASVASMERGGRPAGFQDRMRQKLKKTASDRGLLGPQTGNGSSRSLSGAPGDSSSSARRKLVSESIRRSSTVSSSVGRRQGDNTTTSSTRTSRSNESDDSSLRSASSRRSSTLRSNSGRSLRGRLSASKSFSEDDELSLGLLQKVQRMEREKEKMQQNFDATVASLEEKVVALEGSNEKKMELSTSNVIELKQQLNQAHSRIEELEKQLRKSKTSQTTLQEQLQEAATNNVTLEARMMQQMATIAKLEEEKHELERRQPVPTENNDTLEAKLKQQMSTIAKLEEERQEHARQLELAAEKNAKLEAKTMKQMAIIVKLEVEKQEQAREQQVSKEPVPAAVAIGVPTADPAATRQETRSVSPTLSRGSIDSGDSIRSERLAKLKAFRKSREKSLKDLVLEKQNSPTDVQTVIVNLQDELKAAKEVILQQKNQIAGMQKAAAGRKSTDDDKNDDSCSTLDSNGRLSLDDYSLPLETRFQELQFQYIQLELDRAYGEFKLRDRITEDALKFHRRLRHWKEKSQERQTQLETTMEQHAMETKQLKLDIKESQQQAIAAEQDLQEVKESNTASLKEFAAAQDRVQKLETEVRMCHELLHRSTSANPSQQNHPTECLQQSQLLQSAKERKEEQGFWGSMRVSRFLPSNGERERAGMMN